MKDWFSGWPEPRSRGYWLFSLLVFGGLELLLRIKLGSIYALISIWVVVHYWLLSRLDPDRPDEFLPQRLVDIGYVGMAVSAIIFAGFFFLNAIARSIDPGFRFFQLP